MARSCYEWTRGDEGVRVTLYDDKGNAINHGVMYLEDDAEFDAIPYVVDDSGVTYNIPISIDWMIDD